MVGAQDAGQALGPLTVGDEWQLLGPAQSGAVQETQGAHGLIEAAPRDATVQQVQLEGAHFVGAEQFGRAAEVSGKTRDSAHVGVDGSPPVVAQPQVVDETLSKRSHGGSPRVGKENAQGEP